VGSTVNGSIASPIVTFSNAGTGAGVVGIHSAAAGTEPGVRGDTASASGNAYGVLGRITTATAGGSSAAVAGINQATNSGGYGVYGSHASAGVGVFASSTGGQAVYALAGTGTGVFASGAAGGVYAQLGAGGPSSAAALYGKGTGSGSTALEIRDGALKITNGPAFVHVAAVGNIFGNYTIIDSPYSNNDPFAMILVTPNWGGSGSNVYLNHPIGVYYTGSKWAIFNQDSAAMPVNAAFNVLIIKRTPIL